MDPISRIYKFAEELKERVIELCGQQLDIYLEVRKPNSKIRLNYLLIIICLLLNANCKRNLFFRMYIKQLLYLAHQSHRAQTDSPSVTQDMTQDRKEFRV